jgi:hypothetical protein
MPSALGKGIDKALTGINLIQQLPLNDVIPTEPQAFYEKLGLLKHPSTSLLVKRLAEYQLEVWNAVRNHRRVLCVKSNKVGLTTSSLMLDLQLALLPSTNPLSTRGYDTLLIAQTKDIAREHLRTLRKMITDSPAYAKYLIDSPSEIAENGETDFKRMMRSEQSKTSVIYLRNPDNEKQPSRIIALGMNNPGAILSWRNVKHLHLSDPTATEGDITEAIDNALSRLANTNGSCLVETIPSGPQGKIFEMHRQYAGKEPQPGDFKVITVTAEQAVQAGVISREFLDAEAKRLGPLYSMYYGADFTQGTGNIFDGTDIDLCIQHYDLEFKSGHKVLAADPAFSKNGSKFGLLGMEEIAGIWYVKLCQQYQGMSTTQIIDIVHRLYERDNYSVLKVDSAFPGLISDWQQGTDKRQGINATALSFSEKAATAPVNVARLVNQLKIRIHSQFSELIRQMRTCKYDSHGKLDKSRDSYDLIDCLSMALDGGSWGDGPSFAFLPSDGGAW